MSWLVNFFKGARKAKHIPSLTDALVKSPLFRKFALKFHNEKTEAQQDIDEYLEKQLLTKEQYDEKYSAKRILDTEDKLNDKKINKQWTNKLWAIQLEIQWKSSNRDTNFI